MNNDEINILEKSIKIFFENKDSYYKNEKFKAYFFQGDDSTNNINVIYDNKNYIYYLLNISKEKEYLIKEKNENEIAIIDSSYDLFFYKKSTNPKNINCILLLIINDIDIKSTNENYLEFKSEKLLNINLKKEIINKIKEKIIENLKNEIEKNDIDDITESLLGEKNYNFLVNKHLIENNNDNIKIQIENLSRLMSKVEIIKNKCNNLDIDKLFMNVIEILPPSYSSNLAQKYLSEMPENLYNLMNKYCNSNFNKISFDNYKKNKLLLIKTKEKYNSITENNIKNIRVKKRINKIFRLNKVKVKNKINNNKFKYSSAEIQNEEYKKNKIIKAKEIRKKNYFKIIKQKHGIKENIKEFNDKMLFEQNNKNNVKKKIFKCLTLKRKREKFFIIKNN